MSEVLYSRPGSRECGTMPIENCRVSVVICCHNGSTRLGPTLAHLLRQDVPPDLAWEVVLVDNASTDDTERIARTLWPGETPVPMRVVTEPQLGLIYARLRGLSAARYEIVSFLDDDNWVAVDWVRRVAEIMAADPRVGACGGRTEAVTEMAPPPWFTDYAAWYAVGRQGESTGDITWRRGRLWGAGLTLRKQAWKDLVENGFSATLSGRSGKQMSAGEDTEICYALRLAGWRLWYAEDLMLRHFIPAGRLTVDYLTRLRCGFGRQSIGIDPYRFYVSFDSSDIRSLFGKVWLRQLLREIYIGLFRDRSLWRSWTAGKRKALANRMIWLFHRGRITALARLRTEYDNRLNTFGNNPWIRIDRRTAIDLNREGAKQK